MRVYFAANQIFRDGNDPAVFDGVQRAVVCAITLLL